MEDEFHEINPEIPIRTMLEQLRDIHYQEKPVTEDTSVVIIGPHEEPERARWNRPFRLKMGHFLTFMALITSPTMETFQLWIQREGEWNSPDIPLLSTDKGALRIQVWKGTLPNPMMHAQQVLLRLNWITEYITAADFTQWFLRKARGSPEIDQRGQHERSRRCLLCGSHVLGFPIDNHNYTECIFRRLPGIPRIRFIAINHRAFCSFCGAWSTTHTNDLCRQRACRCGAVDHQSCQELCVRYGGPHLTIQDQDRIALEALQQHYDRCAQLRRNNVALYLCPGDAPSHHTRRLFVKLRNEGQHLVVLGWGKFARLFDDLRIPDYTEYQSRIYYRGLITPEESSARVNSHPLFPPREIDKVVIYGMVIDYLRFETIWIRERRGNEPVLTRPQELGQRAALRPNWPRFPPRPPVEVPPQVPPEEHIQLQPREIIELGNRIARYGGRQVQPQLEAEPLAQNPEENGNVDAEDPPIPDIERPDSPEVQPGQRRQRQWSDDENDFGLRYEETTDSSQEDEAIPEEPQAEEDSDEPDQGNSYFPAITAFNRTSNQWFKFFENEAGPTAMAELEREAEYNSRVNGQLRMENHNFQFQVTTPRTLLEELSDRRIPLHQAALLTRIRFLLRSLVGAQQSKTLQGTYTNDTLKSYVAYLQGVHAFLAVLMTVEHSIPVKISDCPQLLNNPDQAHQLAIPDLETFRWHPRKDHYFLMAENNWYGIYAEKQRDKCKCTRIPHRH